MEISDYKHRKSGMPPENIEVNMDKLKEFVDKNTSVVNTLRVSEYVGSYHLGPDKNEGIGFKLTYKPKFIHRFFMKVLIGFTWFDA